jgi:ribonucleoside-diphosphate reductase alpha chain
MGVTQRIGTGCGKLYVTVNYDDEGICEIFAQMGKSGGCASSQIESIARLISLALRSRMKIEAIIEQMRGIRCPSPLWAKGGMILSCADAIARVLEHHMNGSDPEIGNTCGPEIENTVGSCPDCGGGLMHSEGCAACRACGFTQCS